MTVEKLKLQEKVNLSISMIDACVSICADAIRDKDETIKEQELLEKVGARIMYRKRHHHEVWKLDRFEDLVRIIVKNFNAAGIDYMFSGALAASYYGTPRTWT